ncbi:MAG: hypothetical protein KJ579_07560 [Verrucomicrobia bacterium]|nr:hypothetical protein [Verrucomicrobiota bacterium]
MKKRADRRPGWDEYFIDIAHVVARRSNCSRRRMRLASSPIVAATLGEMQ